MKEIGCPVCSSPLSVRAAEGRKSGKPFIMLICDKDPRHFRGFITHQDFIRGVMEKTDDSNRTINTTVSIGKGGKRERENR
jgi:hypothetical protein